MSGTCAARTTLPNPCAGGASTGHLLFFLPTAQKEVQRDRTKEIYPEVIS